MSSFAGSSRSDVDQWQPLSFASASSPVTNASHHQPPLNRVSPASVSANLASQLAPSLAATASRLASRSRSVNPPPASFAESQTSRVSEEAAASTSSGTSSTAQGNLAAAIAAQRSKRQILCAHAFGPKGCALGALCPYRHATVAAATAAPTATSEANLPGDTSADAAPMQQQQQHQSRIDQMQFEDDSCVRWFWRENTARYTDDPNQWRPFSVEWESWLEEAYLADQGRGGAATYRAAFIVDFGNMSVRNANDGGARRALQRVKCTLAPRWLLVDGERAIMCAAALSERIEFEFVTGRSSLFGIAAGGRPLLINLFTMSAKDPTGNVAMRLVRQPIALQHAGPAASPYNVTVLDQRATFVAHPTNGELFCVVDAAPLKHRDLNPIAEPAYINVEGTERAPTQPCRMGKRCAQLRSSSHVWALQHQCHFGRSANCFLCPPPAPTAAAAAAARPPPATAIAPPHLLSALKQRMAAHKLLFSHETSSSSGSGGSGVDATTQLSPQVVAWRNRQSTSRRFRRFWEDPPAREAQTALYTLHNVHIGSHEGLAVLSLFADPSASASAASTITTATMASELNDSSYNPFGSAAEGGKWLLEHFPRVQRVQHAAFFDRFLRIRNELHLALAERDAAGEKAADASAERVLFLRVPPSALFELLERGRERATFFLSGRDAIEVSSSHTMHVEDVADAALDASSEPLVVVCVAYYNTVFVELPLQSATREPREAEASGCADESAPTVCDTTALFERQDSQASPTSEVPGPATAGASAARPHRVCPPTIASSLVSTGDCPFFTATQAPEWGDSLVTLYDATQFVPLYIVRCRGESGLNSASDSALAVHGVARYEKL